MCTAALVWSSHVCLCMSTRWRLCLALEKQCGMLQFPPSAVCQGLLCFTPYNDHRVGQVSPSPFTEGTTATGNLSLRNTQYYVQGPKTSLPQSLCVHIKGSSVQSPQPVVPHYCSLLSFIHFNVQVFAEFILFISFPQTMLIYYSSRWTRCYLGCSYF